MDTIKKNHQKISVDDKKWISDTLKLCPELSDKKHRQYFFDGLFDFFNPKSKHSSKSSIGNSSFFVPNSSTKSDEKEENINHILFLYIITALTIDQQNKPSVDALLTFANLAKAKDPSLAFPLYKKIIELATNQENKKRANYEIANLILTGEVDINHNALSSVSTEDTSDILRKRAIFAYEYTEDNPKLRSLCNYYLATDNDDLVLVQNNITDQNITEKAWPKKALSMFHSYYGLKFNKSLKDTYSQQLELINKKQARRIEELEGKLTELNNGKEKGTSSSP